MYLLLEGAFEQLAASYRCMTGSLFVNNNGNVVSSAEAVLSADNRSFRYGDGIFETIRFANGKIQFLPHHIERMKRSLEMLKIEVQKEYPIRYQI